MPTRPDSAVLSCSNPYSVNVASRSYKHQYSNIYFIRLQHLRHAVEGRAAEKWQHISGSPILIPRVLDVLKGKICYVIGTVYIDMPLKPNVLQDISRDQSIPAPPPREKFHSDRDVVMLEDESGRIRLVGERLSDVGLVTGIILGVLGVETPSGDFEVIDLCYPEMAPQSTLAFLDNAGDAMNDAENDEWVAVASGLNIGDDDHNGEAIQLLTEYLSGEAGGMKEVSSSAKITHFLITGNSLAAASTANPTMGVADSQEGITDKKSRRYGHEVSAFSTKPINTLSAYLLDIARSIPVHILPGPGDPSGTMLPQQPFPRAMFGAVSSLESFTCETNPASIKLTFTPDQGAATVRSLLAHSGQPLDDMFKYVPTPPLTRLSLAESTLRWRHIAPTAPDTLWCHPYFTDDPFILDQTPDIYIIGNQPRFETKLVTNTTSGTRCRVVLVPSFSNTGQLVIINTRTLNVKTIRFTTKDLCGEIE